MQKTHEETGCVNEPLLSQYFPRFPQFQIIARNFPKSLDGNGIFTKT